MPKKDLKKTFEDNLERAEEIARQLEDGSLSLGESLGKYEDGVKALKACYEILRKAEKKIEALVKDSDGVLKTELFDSEDATAEGDA